METSFTSVLNSEGVFGALRNIILPSAPKMVIFNFIICGSSKKNSPPQLVTLKKAVTQAREMLDSSPLFINCQNKELIPQQTPRMFNNLFFGVGGNIMNLALFIYLMCFSPLK